jgi:coenzyme A diphosphatase NUDT7
LIQRIKSIYHKRTPHILGHEKIAKAAVMVPLLQRGEEVSVLFQVRGHGLRRQPGEICFPGGRMEATDANEQATAIRETCEELGIAQQSIEVIAPLDYLAALHTIIYPFLCQLDEQAVFNPDPDEVAELFTVPLSFLLQHQPMLHYVPSQMKPSEEFPFHLIPNGRNYSWRKTMIPEYFYIYEDKVIWGLTARILHHFLEQIRE